MRRSTVIAIVLIASMILSAIGVYLYVAKERASTAPRNERVVIGSALIPNSALLWIAERNGYFAEEGLDVSIVPHESGVSAFEAMFAGRVDFAAAAEFVAVTKSFARDDFKLITSIAAMDTTSFVARKDRGITGPRQLRGKRIGITVGNQSDYFFRQALGSYGIDSKDVQVVPMSPMELVDGIVGGDIDAAVSIEPFIGKMKAGLGENAIVWSAQGGRRYYTSLYAMNGTVGERSRVIVRLMQALLRADRFVKKDPAAARRIVEDRLQYAYEGLGELWSKSLFELSIKREMVDLMEQEAQWLAASERVVGRIPDYKILIYQNALQAIAPSSGMIIQ